MVGSYTADILQLARILEAASIPYVVTGAQTVAVYGIPRHTADVDVALARSVDEALARLDEAEYLLDPGSVDYVQLRVLKSPSGLRIDLWLPQSLPGEAETFERARTIKIEGEPIRFISPEDIIIRKLWRYRKDGSPIDLEDVRGILAAGTDLDLTYLRGRLAPL